MQFLFLVGVEGTGHHLFRSLLKSHFDQPWFLFEKEWHHPLTKHWDISVTNSEQSKLVASPADYVAPLLENYQRRGVTHLYDNASFPFNLPRDTLRRPDLIEFDQAIQSLMPCRYLVLYRNPVSAAYSAIRRGFTDNVALQARMVEDNLILIQSQMKSLGADYYRTINFEEILSSPEKHIEPLAEWWHLDSTLLKADLANIRAPTDRSSIPDGISQQLGKFFCEQRLSQWHHFYHSNRLLDT